MSQTFHAVNLGGTTDGLLVLSNGRFFRGKLRGAPVEATGEVIFNTSMTGYQEILTDPSYTGQIVTMTYPHIGNYGINQDDMESKTIHASALVVRELSQISSNWRATQTLDDWLIENRIPVLEGADTRSLVKTIRSSGECSGLLVPSDSSHTLDILREEAINLPSMVGQNLARQVSARESYFWASEAETKPMMVIAYDFGIKYNILRNMNSLGKIGRAQHWNTSAEEVLEMNPAGVFLSNGPGDPAVVDEAIQAVKNLLGKLPMFGICLGHQILSLALGCRTFKLDCGHHGGNHPVIDYATEKIEITSHNHGFSVDEKSLPENVRVTHRSLYDQTVEGIESLDHPAYSVQYHPEAAPGPRDASYLFGRFLEMMKS
ncbi:MAG: Carbamoyl-phosphate synthase small chain [Deltaproteobacteria bacterium]|nr:Carbamoyl-phosphate synthase small chain [Deltaproteobacteria bacterium]